MALKIKKPQKGFTLIELMVVVVILAIVAILVVNLFFSTLKGATKTTVLNEVKQNGDYAISTMERLVRNAQTITSSCDGSSSTAVKILSQDNQETTFDCSGGMQQIASTSSLGTVYLTNDKVRLVSETCSFICQKPSLGPQILKIGFSLSQAGQESGLRPEEKAQINFKTTVSLRTYD